MWVANGVFHSHAIAALLIITHVEVLQGVLGMEGPSSSERAAVAGSHYDRDPVRDGV